MLVIDISAWQENVDWDKVVADGVKGVILKLGEGTHLDDMFVEHVNNAVAHGLLYGIYYYAHANTVEGAAAEAEWVAEQIETWLNGVNPPLGIWYDAEDNSMLGGDVTAICSRFVSDLNAKHYNYVGIYASWNWLSAEGAHHIQLEQLADYVPIWVAQYSRHNDLKDEYPHKAVKMWQYTDKLPIADMHVDGNEYYE